MIDFPLLAAVFGVCLACSALVIALLLPMLRRRLVVALTARSDHRQPTPTGGGVGIAAGLLAGAVIALLAGVVQDGETLPLAAFGVGAVLLFSLGLLDDFRPLPVLPRLGAQFLVAAALVAALPATGLAASLGLESAFGLALAAVVAIVAVVWVINAVNFIDGSDLITTAHALPAAIAFAIAFWRADDPTFALLAISLSGALAGFAWFNRPPALVFMGDAGSLLVGFALGALAWRALATAEAPLAPLFLLYPLADASSTLVWRLFRRVRLSEAHRDHAYQAARDHGWSAALVSACVFLAQGMTCALVLAAGGGERGLSRSLLALLAAAVVTGLLIAFRTWRGSGDRRPR